jgi:V/A-type H+-transporting ATPase subunit D
MAKQNIAPTKTNLMKLRDELKFAEIGHDLLDQKRNILVIELLNMVDQTVDFQNRVEASLAKAYKALEEAVLRMGKRRILHLSSAINRSVEMRISSRRVMGVSLPVVGTDFHEHAPYYSPSGTSFWIDSAMAEFKDVLDTMGRLAELKISLIRLAGEVKKTIRKVNALEKTAIPNLRDTVSFIENSLEEYERDMLTIMRMVKERLERQKGMTGREIT